MKNEMTLDKTGLTIPSSELAECGMAGVDMSAQMTHSLLLLMPREMTALQTAYDRRPAGQTQAATPRQTVRPVRLPFVTLSSHEA